MNVQTLSDTALVSALHSIASTMLDIEQRKLKLPADKIREIAANADDLMDEVERRKIRAAAAAKPGTVLASRLTARGLK